jgi:serine/threonine protein phosphatase 1
MEYSPPAMASLGDRIRGWFGGGGAPSGAAAVPDGRAVYAVGDVHGRLDLLDRLLDRIAADAAAHPADASRCLVMLGDYIDRGADSRGVVERLLGGVLPELAPTLDRVDLMGNHEEAMLDFLDGRSDGQDWLGYGGLETLMSYGVPLKSLPRTPEASDRLREDLAQAVPDAHIDFMRACALSHVEGGYAFVHAGVRPGLPLERQDQRDLLWIRDEFLRSRSPLPGWVVVHGHTICDMPQDAGHRINLDTGAFVSGRLTALVLRRTERRFITTMD